ncbi:MAG: PAS domain S-box protein [Caldilineaceae bacterium]
MRTRPLHPDLALAVACLLALLLFLMGIVLPQAHLWGSFLVPIVLVFLWGRARDIYIVAAVASVLLTAAYWTRRDATLGAFLSYHVLSLAILWGAAWLLSQRRQAHERMLAHERELDAQVKTRTAALAASEARFARLFNSSPAGIVLTRLADGTFLEVNEAFIAMVGFTREELIGRTTLELGIITPDDRRRRNAALQAQGQVRSADLVLHTKRGEELRTLISMERMDMEGEEWLLSSIVDITVHKELEDALAASEHKYRDLYDNSPAMYMSGSPADHIIRDCNLTLARALGYTREELIGRPNGIVLTPASYSHMLAALPNYLAAGKYADLEVQLQCKDGTVLDALMSGQIDPPTADRPAYSRVTFYDITARKQAEAAIKAALVQEKELGELKSRFVSMASHEFRNPLAGILATTELLELRWEKMDKAKIDERLNRIRDQVLHLSAIMEDVLHLTRMQTGHGKFAPAAGDLDGLCGRVVGELRELPGYGDRIGYDCALRPLPALFDAHLLQQAIGNLVHNALKYSPPDKSVHITLAQRDGQVTLRVADEGIGIPPEDLAHLFEPFHRAANVGAIQGTGLGLAIAKEAVELHGGTIAVESQVGVGTVFIVTLPGGVEAA